MNKIKLDNNLRDKLETIEWLLNPKNRGTGRTTLMAISYINIALKNPGTVIEVNDHHPGRESSKMMLDIISRIAHDIGLTKRLRIGRDNSFWIEPEIIHEFIKPNWNASFLK